MQKLDDLLYNKFILAFKSIENMYVISNNKIDFTKILNQNKLFFSENILQKLLNPKLKIQSELLYKNILQKGIKIYKIKILNKYIYTFIYGNVKLLNSSLKKMYIYNYNISKYGKLKYKYFTNNSNIKEHVNVCTDNSNIKVNSKNIVILDIVNVSMLRSILVEILDKENLYIFSLYNVNKMLLISDILLLLEAKYEKNIVEMVDQFLDNGKEILTLPGDVWNKNCYFSNFLIKEGANIVLNIKDINDFL